MHRSKNPKYLYIIRATGDNYYHIGSNMDILEFWDHIFSKCILKDFYFEGERHVIASSHIVSITQQHNNVAPNAPEDDLPF